MILPKNCGRFTRVSAMLYQKERRRELRPADTGDLVIDTDGTIAAFVDVDYRNRLEPAEIVAALQSLNKQPKGAQHANRSR
jgi:hypothetical protein